MALADITNPDNFEARQTARAVIRQLRAQIRILRHRLHDHQRQFPHSRGEAIMLAQGISTCTSYIRSLERLLDSGSDTGPLVDQIVSAPQFREVIPLAVAVGDQENLPPPPPLRRQVGGSFAGEHNNTVLPPHQPRFRPASEYYPN